jgi:hypothetical protein
LSNGPQPAELAKAGTEHAHQVALFAWAALQVEFPELRLMFAIPNGGQRNVIVATQLKAEGVKAHVPDIFLPVARGRWHGLFIELKKPGGRAHPGQQKYIENLRGQGFGAVVCIGWEVAAANILAYLNWKESAWLI